MSRPVFILAMTAQVILLFWSVNLPFFWDSIQFGSRHASWFWETGHFWLPSGMDSGNPPLLGWLVDGVWHLTGRHLWAAHLVIWPFAVLNLFLLARVAGSVDDSIRGWAPLLWIANPVYAAQTTLVSPDVLLVTGMLLLWSGSIARKHWQVLVGACLAALVSLRGGGLVAGIAIWWMLSPRYRPLVLWLLIGSIPAAAYHVGHYLSQGWALVPSRSPWATGFLHSQPWNPFRLALIYAWRLLDHGNLAIWLGILLGAIPMIRKRRSWPEPVRWLLVTVLVLSPFFLGFPSLNMHRYLLPVFLAGTVLVAGLVRTWHRIVLLCILASGNFWIYPDSVAKGWDASLAWLAYPAHREKAVAWLDRMDPEFRNSASAFPNLGPEDELMLNGRSRAFTDLRDCPDCRYVLYSNVFNDVTDEEYRRIMSWPVRFASGHWPVRVIIFENPEYARTGS